jgi:hypothetical protein
METKQEPIQDLLIDIIQDNPSYQFPIQIIQEDLYQLFTHHDEFDYFMMRCYNTLNDNHHSIFGNTFLNIIQDVLDTNSVDVYSISTDEYELKIDKVISILENTYITRVEKNTPDGEMLKLMAT